MKVKGWKHYEKLKAEWIEKNPDATPQQYEQAINLIARMCGV
jgi:hypothetical protein